MKSKILLATLMLGIGTANALTYEQSLGMVHAKCAGVYLAEVSITYGKNRSINTSQIDKKLDFASEQATLRIGDAKTEQIGDKTAHFLINLYQKNNTSGAQRLTKELLMCDQFLAEKQQKP
jgi:hypothetical protein